MLREGLGFSLQILQLGICRSRQRSKISRLEGVQQSVALYTKVLSDLTLVVEDQVTEGHRVTSRFVVSGTSFGKRVRFAGITISRFKDGVIVEDWSVTDTLGMLRQLGVWRSVLVLRRWRALKDS